MKIPRLATLGGVACLLLGLACSDPHQQTIEPAGSAQHDDFVAAMKKLPLDEKNLVNEYVARRESEGVRPVGVTIAEAIAEQKRHEAEVASLPGKIIDGAVRVAQALGNRPPTLVPVPVPADPAHAAPLPTVAPVAPPTITPVAPVPAPVAPAAPPAGVATGAQMSELFQQIDARHFPGEKLDLLKERAPSLLLTTRQAIALARTMSHASHQVEVLSLLYPRVVDPQNFGEAYDSLPFDPDRQALRARVEAMRGR